MNAKGGNLAAAEFRDPLRIGGRKVAPVVEVEASAES